MIDMSLEKYEALKKWYVMTYEKLALHYLLKRDAKLFLSDYALKSDGLYMPVKEEIKKFVTYYWELHQSMGREIDESVKRESWQE